MRTVRDRNVLVATAALAVGVPVGAAAWVEARTAALAERLADTAQLPVRIGGVDADLTGAVRLSDVAVGDLIAADAIEASVALESLLSGELRADEIRVAAPRVTVDVDAHGDSDLARLARRFQRPGRGAARARGRVRRIVVSEGALTARIAGIGELSAHDVELVPDAGGVRVVTGRVDVRGEAAPVGVRLAFSRSAAELALPTMALVRVLAVGGRGEVSVDGHTVTLRDVAAGRLSAAGALELRAAIDDAGVARPVSAEVTPGAITLRGEHVPLDALAPVAPAGVQLGGARASGTLHVRGRRAAMEVEADGQLAGVVVEHRTLATGGIPLDLTFATSLVVSPDAIAVPRLDLQIGAIRTRLAGWLRRVAPLSGRLDARLDPARCDALLASLPAELRGPLDGMVLDGELGATARLAVDLAAPAGDGVVLTTAFEGACKVLGEPPAADVATLAAPTDQPDWVHVRRLPGRVYGAFVSAEDGRFWEHRGFDLFQIARSLEIDLREGRLIRGGSTISQQLVKNAFLTHRRTLDRKLQEAILTWRLEARLDKHQILERYLNLIELGPRVHGIRAAARYWFGVSPRDLSARQAAFLAALTSEPTTMARRVRRHGGLDPASAERVATVLRAMRRDGVIGDATFEEARHAPLFFASAALRAEP